MLLYNDRCHEGALNLFMPCNTYPGIVLRKAYKEWKEKRNNTGGNMITNERKNRHSNAKAKQFNKCSLLIGIS